MFPEVMNNQQPYNDRPTRPSRPSSRATSAPLQEKMVVEIPLYEESERSIIYPEEKHQPNVPLISRHKDLIMTDEEMVERKLEKTLTKIVG